MTIVDTINFKERLRDNLEGADSTCATLAIDGKKALVGTKHGEICLWDAGGEVLGRIFRVVDRDDKGRVNVIGSLAAHPTLRCVAAGLGNGQIRLYHLDMYNGFSRRGTLSLHTSRVTCILFSEDGNLLLSGGVDRKGVLWEVPEESLEALPDAVTGDNAGMEDEFDFDDAPRRLEVNLDSEVTPPSDDCSHSVRQKT